LKVVKALSFVDWAKEQGQPSSRPQKSGAIVVCKLPLHFPSGRFRVLKRPDLQPGKPFIDLTKKLNT
jgi:hypothetical protein